MSYSKTLLDLVDSINPRLVHRKMKKGTDIAVRFDDFYIVHQNLPAKRTMAQSFSDHILFMPLSGELSIACMNDTISAGPGFMVYVPPHVVHEFRSSEKAGERIIVMFKTASSRLAAIGVRKLPLSQLLKEIVFYLLTHAKATSAASLRDVFIQTLGELIDANANSESPHHLLGKVNDARLKKAAQIFEARFAENLKVDEVAKASGLSARTMTRLLMQEVGLSPKQLIVSLRVEEAKRLLLEGTSVLEAAQAVGYESLSQFIASFRSRTGQLPSKFVHVG